MVVDLKSILLESGRKTGLEMSMPSLPEVYEKELAQIYLKATRLWTKSVIDDLLAEYKTELTTDSPASIIQSIDARLVQVLLTFGKDYEDWANRATRYHYQTLVRKLKYSTNIDLSSVISARGSRTTIDNLLGWNTELIRNVAEETRQRIASSVYSGLTNGTPVREVAKEIRTATGMSSARARRIASDQTVKLSSSLDAERLKDLGCEGYAWEHSRKLHPREDHKARQGDFIKFGSEIDRMDAPGQAPFCGCKRRMVL